MEDGVGRCHEGAVCREDSLKADRVKRAREELKVPEGWTWRPGRPGSHF